VEEHRHGARNRVGDLQLFKTPHDLLEALVDGAILLEVHAGLPEALHLVLPQRLFIFDHASSLDVIPRGWSIDLAAIRFADSASRLNGSCGRFRQSGVSAVDFLAAGRPRACITP